VHVRSPVLLVLTLLAAACGGPEPTTVPCPAPVEALTIPEPRHEGLVTELPVRRGFLEVTLDAEFGAVGLYLTGPEGDALEPDEPPVLNVRTDADHSLRLVASRESWLGETDGGWHFADDVLLDTPEGTRFRLVLDGRVHTPALPKPHVHGASCDAPPHLTLEAEAGAHGGYVLTLGDKGTRLEVLHNEHWGLVSIYLTNASKEPMTFGEVPVLNAMIDDLEPEEIEAGREDWEGNEDGGWHFESDALLGQPERGRFRLVVDGKTYVPPCEHVHLDGAEGPGHTHGESAEE